ncbi:MAG: ATP-binding protein [Flavobacteriales bacterium]|nr:ATP-binding protein [Flavobacteriales bacterium]
MKKIAIVGPESSGKSTLARDLGRHGIVVGEFARPYLTDSGPGYEEADLLTIAQAQARAEDEAQILAEQQRLPMLICDTDLLTIRIWSEEKYDRCDPWIREQSEQRQYDLWLLCTPDIPWEPDPLRENPHDRDRLFGVYQAMLEQLRKPYIILSGDRQLRLRTAIEAMDRVGL